MEYDERPVDEPVENDGVDEPIDMDTDGPVDEAPAETEQPITDEQTDLVDRFRQLLEHDSTPSLRLSDVQKIRFTELAKDLEDARVQAYIQANFGMKALEFLRSLIPLLASFA